MTNLKHSFKTRYLHRYCHLCLALTASAFSAVSTAIAQPFDYFSDPNTPSNWWVDGANQKILSRAEHLQKLSALRSECESTIAARDTNPEIRANTMSVLLTVYPMLGEPARADAIASLLEKTDSDGIDLVLLDYYRRTNNDQGAVRMINHLAAKDKASKNPENATRWLGEAGDLYRKMHQFEQADKVYKEVADLAIKNIVEPKRDPNFKPGSSLGFEWIGGRAEVGPLEKYAYFLAEQNRLSEAARYADKALDCWLPPGAYGLVVSDGGSDFYLLFLDLIKSKDKNLWEHFYGRYRQLTENNAYFGLLSPEGKEITPPDFGYIGELSEGLIAAKDKKTGRFGYIDKLGVWQIKPQFLAARAFAGGLAPVKMPRPDFPLDMTGRSVNYCLVDRAGKVVSQLPCAVISGFDGTIGFGSVPDDVPDGPTSIVDKTGEILFDGAHGQPLAVGNEEFYICQQTGQSSSGCIISALGYVMHAVIRPDEARSGHFKIVQLPMPGDSALSVHPPKRLNAIVAKLIKQPPQPSCDHYGSEEIIRSIYKELRPSFEGLAAVQNRQNLWGFVDRSGREVVAPKYKKVTDFKGGFATYLRVPTKAEWGTVK